MPSFGDNAHIFPLSFQEWSRFFRKMALPDPNFDAILQYIADFC